MSYALDALELAAAQLRDAEGALQRAGKTALRETLDLIFTNPEVKDVAWGQKTSDYDDEGMYPGFMGPVVNEFSTEDGDVEVDDWWSKLYDGGYGRSTSINEGFSRETRLLKTVLDKIGAETMCEIIGDDEHVVVAYRDGEDVRIYAEDVRY